MDPILQILLSWQFIIFGLSIAAVVFVLRTIVEYVLSTFTQITPDNKLWTTVILPILPVILGAADAFLFRRFPYPDGLTSATSRVMFGLVAGLLSTLIYRIISDVVGQKITTIVKLIKTTTTQTVTTQTTNQPIEQKPQDQIPNKDKI